MPGLPPIEPTKVEMPPAAWKAYKEIENDFITRLGDGVIVAANQAVAGGKCRQLANGALYEDVGSRTYIEVHESKLDALQSILEEINGSPTLVLYEFHHDRERILRRIGSSTPYLGGGTTASKSTRIIENFNRGNIPVLLGHPGSMGHGLNLQERCHHVIWFGITWNFEYYDQAIRRVYRQGQQHPVFLYHIVAEGTLDETVMEVLRSKERTQENLYSRLTTWRNGNGTGRTSEGDVQRDVGRSLEHNDHISREGGSQGR
jgi:reverse gyrase